ncbi:ubiquitin carboxyl-terminal hydrolase-domain-containing protein [Globomyces pollinis-pini]|nr:ubiquitin carboxyl-terminal hydrolase-domain-containing protein [Globomyces pollinis-pini]
MIGAGGTSLRYTSFPAHNQPANQIVINDLGVFSTGYDNVRFTNRRGVMQWNKLCTKSTCLGFTNIPSELVVGSSSGTIMIMNISRGSVIKQFDVDQGIVGMKMGKMIATSLSSGHISFRDPTTFKQEHSIEFHSGGISSLDISGFYLVTTGCSIRGSNLIPDPLIKVFDLRSLKFLPPLSFPDGPSLVRFHPNYTATILAATPTGRLRMIDINDKTQSKSQFYQSDVSGYLTSMEFSSSGELFALGDSFGAIQMWYQRDSPKINKNSRQSLYRHLVQPMAYPEITEHMPLSTVGMPYYTKPLLSIWPNNLVFPIGKPSPKIPPEILKNVKMVDFVGYAPNPKLFKRNQVLVSNSGHPKEPKFRSEQELESMKSGDRQRQIGLFDQANNVSIDVGIPFHYKSVEIKYSRFGVEDFDFGFYNQTEYGGLETDIRNSYCNSLLQMLFFIWPLREIAKTHIRTNCFKEPCLTCELGFLFRMLEGSRGVNCQASNFLRAFGLVQQANALGLLEPEHMTSESQISYGSLIQTFCRFIIEQIHQECIGMASESDHFLQQLFQVPLLSTSRCHDQNHTSEREISPFVVDLNYPRRSNNTMHTFVEILEKSINKEHTTKAWCADCKQYQMTTQTKGLIRTPNFMLVNANCNTDNDVSYWIEDVSTKHSWLPSTIAIILQDGNLKIIDLTKQRVEDLDVPIGAELAVYDLRATIAEIKIKKGPGHLVAHVNVSDNENSPSWYLFNAFSVLPLEGEERVFRSWKIPAIIQFAKRSHETKSSFFLSPVNPDFRILLDNHLLNERKDLTSSCVPLNLEEIPSGPGYLCAIDAEFVVMASAESEVRSDGTNTIIRPSRYGLARVSVVRGEDGPLEGIPFIDDYVCTTEPVLDYLTEFSGIQDGDLDTSRSTHPLVSLKVAYKRLRLLVDMGCIFVGHDLRKDCRTINIHIPPSQIIDTVTIFKFKNRQRKLSLRFLAWCILQQDIQTVTHDSVEDARTALLLYKKYLEIKEKGNFEKVMEDIYEEGRSYNFKPPSQRLDPRQRIPSSELF